MKSEDHKILLTDKYKTDLGFNKNVYFSNIKIKFYETKSFLNIFKMMKSGQLY